MLDIKTSVSEDKFLDKFLRYISIDTQSDPNSSTYPSTSSQKILSELLVKELKSLGVSSVEMDEYGYVYASIDANTNEKIPSIGFIAHLDTSPDMSGKNVKYQIHRNYDGKDIVLSDKVTLSVEESKELKNSISQTIITTDGNTLLGADDKAGVAAIMCMAEFFINNPSIKHGPIKIGFTLDEEIGAGVKYFDVDRFGAKYAYTVDGGGEVGTIDNETFSADAAKVEFFGKNVHPGVAKNKMLNSLKIASYFISSLPKRLSPETTEKRQPFIHPMVIKGEVDSTTVEFIIRSFNDEDLKKLENIIKRYANKACSRYKGSSCKVEISETYRNMKEILDKNPDVVNNALEAVRMCGLSPKLASVRGGTDGSNLSFRGLPTANIFAGSNLAHSRLEWASVEVMLAATEVLINIVKIWAK